MSDLYDKLYQVMCSDCPNAWKCHERCEECEEFQEELERLEGEEKCQDKD